MAPITSYYDNLSLNATASRGEMVCSPVTLCQDWQITGRLLFLVCCAIFGCVTNMLFVAAFFIEQSLKKLGNVYMACIGLSDMLVTTVVIPAAAVVLLSRYLDSFRVCQGLSVITITSTYCYSVFYMLAALESYIRICRPTREYKNFIKLSKCSVSLLLYLIAISIASVGVYLSLDYGYCNPSHKGNIYFRIITAVLFYVIPCIVTVYCLSASFFHIFCRARDHWQYKRSQQYDLDKTETTLNLIVHIIFMVSWAPYLILVYKYPDASAIHYYFCAWMGVFRPVLTNFFYGIFHPYFRSAYGQLIKYCCCKHSLPSKYTKRQRRALEYGRRAGDVNLHRLHHDVIPGQMRTITSARDERELSNISEEEPEFSGSISSYDLPTVIPAPAQMHCTCRMQETRV